MSSQLNGLLRDLRIELFIVNDRIAGSLGLNPRDLDVLDVIDREGPCTPKYLAARVGVHAATLTGMLVRLQADGWITRARDPADRRSAYVSASARFAEIRACYAAGTEQVRQAAAALSPSGAETVASFLAQVTAIIRSHAEQFAQPGNEGSP